MRAILYALLWAASVAPVQAQDAFFEPARRSSSNGMLNTSLDIHVAEKLVAGRKIVTAAYEGTIPGPTLEVRPGDMLQIHLKNSIDRLLDGTRIHPYPGACVPIAQDPDADGEMKTPVWAIFTNLHTHGLQVAPEFPPTIPYDPRNLPAAPRGDNPLLVIKPGQTCDYAIQLPRDQPGGLYWYHPHVHMATSRQMWGGMAGAIIVRGLLDEAPGVKEATEHLLILQELLVDNWGRVPSNHPAPTAGFTQFGSIPPVPTNEIYAVNGVGLPVISARPGEVQRWRLLAASSHRFFNLCLTPKGPPAKEDPYDSRCDQPVTFHQIGQDGIGFPAPVAHTTINLAPANRVDVLLQVPKNAAGACAAPTYALRALPYDQGHPGGTLPAIDLATVRCWGPPKDARLPDRLICKDARGVDVLCGEPPLGPTPGRARQVVFSGDLHTAVPRFYLDFQQFDDTHISQAVEVGTVEEWTLVNLDVFQHPFHIHVNPFEVVELGQLVPAAAGDSLAKNGFRLDANGKFLLQAGTRPPFADVWWDTFALPPHGYAKVRMRFRPDTTGTTVYHCHILPHEDMGMMALFRLCPKGDQKCLSLSSK